MEGGLDRDHDISMPTKLTQLRYSGYSAEFLDRVEPNGNIPGKNGTSIAGNYLGMQYNLFIVPTYPGKPEDQLTDGGTSSQNVPYLYYGNSEKRNIQKFQKCTILDD